MRIGVEVMAAVLGRRAGVGQYTDELTRELAKLSQENPDLEFVWLANQYAPATGDSPPYLQTGDLYPRYQFRQYLLWLQGWLPWAVKAARLDLCHFPNFLAPLGPLSCPSVLTIHDMSAFLHPQNHTRLNVGLQRLIVPRAARRARFVLTDSQQAGRDIVEILKIPAEKVRPVYLGISDLFHQTADPSAEQAILEKYGINFPYVFSVGTLEPRKNLSRQIEAFDRLVRQENLPHHLVLSGGTGWKDNPIMETVQKLSLKDRVHFLGYVPRPHLPALYRGAAVFTFVSLKEGFGLPVVEAMACGTPVLTSTDPTLQEVSGGATLLAQAHNVEEIAAGLYKLLTNSQEAEHLRQLGRERASFFSWENTARQTLAVYREALQ